MSSNRWSWQDEIQRLALSYIQNPPTITEILDQFEQVTKPKTPGAGNGFTDVVDDPRASTPPPPPEETPVANSRLTNTIHLYTCPACHTDVEGSATYELVNGLNPSRDDHDDDGYVNVDMKLIGVRASSHSCAPTVTR